MVTTVICPLPDRQTTWLKCCFCHAASKSHLEELNCVWDFLPIRLLIPAMQLSEPHHQSQHNRMKQSEERQWRTSATAAQYASRHDWVIRFSATYSRYVYVCTWPQTSRSLFCEQLSPSPVQIKTATVDKTKMAWRLQSACQNYS